MRDVFLGHHFEKEDTEFKEFKKYIYRLGCCLHGRRRYGRHWHGRRRSYFVQHVCRRPPFLPSLVLQKPAAAPTNTQDHIELASALDQERWRGSISISKDTKFGARKILGFDLSLHQVSIKKDSKVNLERYQVSIQNNNSVWAARGRTPSFDLELEEQQCMGSKRRNTKF